MFDVDRFVADCRGAAAASGASGVLEVVAKAVATPAEVLKVLGEPADVPDGRIEAAGARALSERDAIPLGCDIIHSVINPIKRLTGAIHVYGGDFFAVSRSEWDPEHLVEGPYDVERTLALFEESNRLYPPA